MTTPLADSRESQPSAHRSSRTTAAPDRARPPLVARIRADNRFRYLVVGGGTAVVDFVTFNLLVLAGFSPAGANVISFCIAVVVNFSGYRWWSFAGNHDIRGRAQFAAYLTLALVNVAITTAIVHRLDQLGTPPWIAKLGCMAMVTVWNYVLLNYVIFRRTSPAPSQAAP